MSNRPSLDSNRPEKLFSSSHRSTAWKNLKILVVRIAVVCVLLGQVGGAQSLYGSSAGREPGEGAGQFRLVAVTSGTKGEEKDGRFVMEDPRTTFVIPDDQQILVYFEWEGPLGPHHFQAVWKNPDGKAVSLGDMNSTAEHSPFGVYFGLKLDANVTPGVWTVEAQCDGQAKGSSSFQIVSNLKPAAPQAPPAPISAGEAYKLAMASTVSVEKLDEQGKRLTAASGFFIAGDTLLTTFGAIDGAASLQVSLPNKESVPVTGVAAWNRRQDWAVLRVAPQKFAALKIASSGTAQVGDTYFSLNTSQGNNRTIVEGSVTGDGQVANFGERLNLSYAVGPRANGSPVLNEHGEVVGIEAPDLSLPGSEATDIETGSTIGATAAFSLMASRLVEGSQGPVAVPARLVRIPAPDSKVQTLQDLAKDGQMTPMLRSGHSVWRGFTAKGIQRNGEMPIPINEKSRFSRQDGHVVVLVEWDAITSLKFQASMELYTLDNQEYGNSKTLKVSAPSGRKAIAAWTIPIAGLKPGIYRVDVLEDSTVVWRTFIHIED